LDSISLSALDPWVIHLNGKFQSMRQHRNGVTSLGHPLEIFSVTSLGFSTLVLVISNVLSP